jgi:NAD+ kinase
MQNIGLVLKRSEADALELGEQISRFIRNSGKQVLVESSCADLAESWHAKVVSHITDEADLLVVLGGDGTILRAVHLMNAKPTPVLGINLGRIGYMAEISPSEAIGELQAVLNGQEQRVERMLLEVTLPDGAVARVLNDVVIHWGRIARLIDLGIRIGAAREIELRADGLIVSTPLGSSAYSYAASGPLIHPDLEGILLTPICPFAGLMRPLMIPPDMETELLLRKGSYLTLTLDGHTTFNVDQGQSIKISRAPMKFVMIKSRVRDYVDVLKEKLGFL